jgi:chromosome segregation ATPase
MPKAKLEPAITYSIPKLETLSPELAELYKKEREIKSRQQSLEEEWSRLLYAPTVSASASRVAIILGDADADEAPISTDTSRRRLSELSQERTDLSQALNVVRGRIAEKRRQAATLAWADLAPIHNQLVRQVCMPLVEARRAVKTLWRFRNAVNDADISWGTVEHFTGQHVIGGSNGDDRLGDLLQQAVAAGYISAAEIE